jgi:hypothetical protein
VDNFFPRDPENKLLGRTRKKRRKKSEIKYWGLSDKKSV